MSVDRLVQEHMTRYRVPGLSLAIARHGTVLQASGYGFANVEHQVPATAATVYQTASVGKQFTAALVMLLVERGQLSLDERIGPRFEAAPPEWTNITLRHLLTHTAGISDDPFAQLNLRLDYTDQDLFDRIASAPLEFEPGTAWNYSNSGYILLGLLIARVAGRFYGDLLSEWIFRPLGMTTARVISEEEIIPDRAAGYRLDGDLLRNQEYVSPSLNRTADGGLYVTVHDLAIWDRELSAGTLLARASRQAMWTAVQLASGVSYPYGFGWSVQSSPRGRMVDHDGEWQGFSTYFARYLDDGFSIMALANLADAPLSELAQEMASAKEILV